jgi:2',3'-cyclic-nucleotide 2'-phosphodiesterase
MKIVILGDLLGRTGREAALKAIPHLRDHLKLDCLVVNGENASHGFGLAPEMAEALFAAGADAITLGNHAWDRREIIPYIAQEKRLIRPLNFPPGTPGSGASVITAKDGRRVLVAQLMGRLFMDPLDCPFQATEALLGRHRLGNGLDAVLLDFHAEATSEKMAFGHAFDGRASAIFGTHTHVPTADHQVLPNGTGFVTDLGMCGDYDSVIGMGKEAAMARFIRKMPGERLSPAEGEATVCGLFVETDERGLALRVEPVRLGGRLRPAMPQVLS